MSHPRTVVLALGLAATACNQHSLVGATQGGGHTQSDTYIETAVGKKADILFVINDTDLTMVVKATTMGNSAVGFTSYLTANGVDFHIAVTTMDMDTPSFLGLPTQGRFKGPTKVIDQTTPNLLATLQSNLQVGFIGAHDERGFDTSVAAVTAPLVTGDDAGFLRSDARLFVVFLSDEDDKSAGSIASYVSAFDGAKGGNPGLVTLSAIAGPVPSGCGGGANSGVGGDPGVLYNQILTATNGLFESVCDPDYSTFLDNLGFHAGSTQAQFFLTQTPLDPASIQVEVNGSAVPSSSWTYDATTNSITFVPGQIPPAGATVTITYDVP